MTYRRTLAGAIIAAILILAAAAQASTGGASAPDPADTGGPSTSTTLEDTNPEPDPQLVALAARGKNLRAVRKQLMRKLRRLSGRAPRYRHLQLTPATAADHRWLHQQLRKDISRLRDRIRFYRSGAGFWLRLRAQIPAHGRAWLNRLGSCEADTSGGYRANTGNGYYGRYQFSESTWNATAQLGLPAPTTLPHQASPAEQDVRAWRLRLRDGTGHWPVCG